MARRIKFHVGDIVSYYSAQYEATQVYPYIAYLKELRKDSGERKEICVGMGDLVMGGAYLVGRKNADIFTYSVSPQPQQQALIKVLSAS